MSGNFHQNFTQDLASPYQHFAFSHGFKFGIHLANTGGIIDEDYYGSDNEGHIFIKLVNDSVLSTAKPMEIKKGDAFCQGIFVPFGITVDDDATEIRNGGFGSTGK